MHLLKFTDNNIVVVKKDNDTGKESLDWNVDPKVFSEERMCLLTIDFASGEGRMRYLITKMAEYFEFKFYGGKWNGRRKFDDTANANRKDASVDFRSNDGRYFEVRKCRRAVLIGRKSSSGEEFEKCVAVPHDSFSRKHISFQADKNMNLKMKAEFSSGRVIFEPVLAERVQKLNAAKKSNLRQEFGIDTQSRDDNVSSRFVDVGSSGAGSGYERRSRDWGWEIDDHEGYKDPRERLKAISESRLLKCLVEYVRAGSENFSSDMATRIKVQRAIIDVIIGRMAEDEFNKKYGADFEYLDVDDVGHSCWVDVMRDGLYEISFYDLMDAMYEYDRLELKIYVCAKLRIDMGYDDDAKAQDDNAREKQEKESDKQQDDRGESRQGVDGSDDDKGDNDKDRNTSRRDRGGGGSLGL